MRYWFLLLSAVFTLAASADPGDLDLGFGKHTGWKRIPDANPVAALIQQQDGKLVSAGTCNGVDKKPGFCLQRYNSNGSLDSSFNAVGRVVTNIRTNAYVYALLQQPDGKLLAAGSSNDADDNGYITLARYNSDGSLDNSFGTNGIAVDTSNAGWNIASANAVVRLDDGKLLVAGYKLSTMPAYDAKTNHILLARYNADGTPDTTFNSTGKVVTAIDDQSAAQALIVQHDGKLLVGGYVNTLGAYDDYRFMLTRYQADGSLDTAFGSNGSVITRINSNAIISNLVEQADGKLVAVGTSRNGAALITVARYNSDGSLDNAFNGTGSATVPLSLTTISTYGHAIYQQSDGKLLVLGEGWNLNASGNFTIALVRYNVNGSLDTGFAKDGVLLGTISFLADVGLNGSITAMIQQADKKIVAVGPVNDKDTAIARFLNEDSDHDGEDEHEIHGTSVTTGDMNDDGIDDVIVGSPARDVTQYLPVGAPPSIANSVIETTTGNPWTILHHAGSIKILSGKDLSLLRTIEGTAENQRLGTALATVADQNSDGVPDLLVGEPNALLGKGRVRLYSGKYGELIKTVVTGSVSGQQFAAAISMGDVNHDAVADLVVGVPGAKRVIVYDGAALFAGKNPPKLYTRKGSGISFGAAVAVDSQHRLLVGSPSGLAGKVEVFAGDNGDSPALFSLSGTQKGEKFGSAIGVAASSGYWLIGSPRANETSVVNGKTVIKKSAGKFSVFSSGDAALLSEKFGNAAGDHYGGALNAASDIDKDGASDLVIGAPAADVSSPDGSSYRLRKKSGRVNVVSGVKLMVQ